MDHLLVAKAEIRDLENEVARLRAALERAVQHLYNPFEPDNQSGAYIECMAALGPR